MKTKFLACHACRPKVHFEKNFFLKTLKMFVLKEGKKEFVTADSLHYAYGKCIEIIVDEQEAIKKADEN